MSTNVKLMVVLGKLITSFQEPLNKDLEELGLGSSMYLMLAHLSQVDRAKTQKLGEVAFITSGTITHTVNKMIKLGYAIKMQDHDDKRVYWIQITPLGKETFNAVHLKHLKYLDRLLEGVSDDEKLAFIDQVKHIGKTIETNRRKQNEII